MLLLPAAAAAARGTPWLADTGGYSRHHQHSCSHWAGDGVPQGQCTHCRGGGAAEKGRASSQGVGCEEHRGEVALQRSASIACDTNCLVSKCQHAMCHKHEGDIESRMHCTCRAAIKSWTMTATSSSRPLSALAACVSLLRWLSCSCCTMWWSAGWTEQRSTGHSRQQTLSAAHQQ